MREQPRGKGGWEVRGDGVTGKSLVCLMIILGSTLIGERARSRVAALLQGGRWGNYPAGRASL